MSGFAEKRILHADVEVFPKKQKQQKEKESSEEVAERYRSQLAERKKGVENWDEYMKERMEKVRRVHKRMGLDQPAIREKYGL